jgi:N-acetylmuramoyl-L-alanine amidase
MKNMVVFGLILFLFCGALYAENANQNPTDFLAVPTGTALSNGSPKPPSPTVLPANPIRIVEPVENAHIPAVSSTFVCGSVPAGGKLLINGTPVPVHPGGGFLTMVQLSPDKFDIKAELQLGDTTYQFTRTVFVAGPGQPAPISPLTVESISPKQDQELLPGDDIEVVCKGSPGMKAYFTVKGAKGKFPMIESETSPGGIYRGVYRVGSKDKLNHSKIKVTLESNENRKVSREADCTLSLFPDHIPVMAEVKWPDVVLRAGPALTDNDQGGYLMFPPPGTILRITGRKGDEYRVRLTKTKTVWVSANQVKLLPEGTAPGYTVAGNVTIGVNERSTLIRLPLGRKIPYKIDPDAEGKYIDITFYGAFSNTDWINNAAAGIIKNLSWFQDDEETYRLRAYTVPNGWWGYDARFEGNVFVFEFRTPPPPAATGNSPLNGLTIAVDAGHTPDTGAIGATGYAEKDANMAQAQTLKEKLLAKGARVIMIHQGSENVPLGERPKIAWKNKADILISMHNNSLGYGGNPFLKHGYGVYYFTPMSLPLAREIHDAYGETFSPGGQFNLPDDGLYYGNLALTRAPQMPSILVESAYMIVPEEEAYLKTDSFRSACADAIVSGMERYTRNMRVQLKVK